MLRSDNGTVEIRGRKLELMAEFSSLVNRLIPWMQMKLICVLIWLKSLIRNFRKLLIMQLKKCLVSLCEPCGRGGIGRRKGLKILWWKHRVGSNPIARISDVLLR